MTNAYVYSLLTTQVPFCLGSRAFYCNVRFPIAKQAFEKAKQKRDENIKIRKAQQKQLNDEQEAIKNAVIEKRNRNLIKKNKKEIKKIIQNEYLLSSSSDEEEIILKKK